MVVHSPVGASPLRPGRTSAPTGPVLYGAPAFSCAALSPHLAGSLGPSGSRQGELLKWEILKDSLRIQQTPPPGDHRGRRRCRTGAKTAPIPTVLLPVRQLLALTWSAPASQPLLARGSVPPGVQLSRTERLLQVLPTGMDEFGVAPDLIDLNLNECRVDAI